MYKVVSSIPQLRFRCKSEALQWSLARKSMEMQTFTHSVVIPAKNEGERIGFTLEKVFDHMSTNYPNFECIVIDDGSHDNTREVVEGFQRRHPNFGLTPPRINIGKGFSVMQGMLASRGSFAIFMDADSSTPIEMLDRFMPHFDEGCDIVIGSRGLRESDIVLHQPFHREMMGKTYNFFVRWIADLDFKDTQCGFKGFTRKAADRCFQRQRIDGFSFDVELLFLAKRLGLKIAEVPVKWADSPKSTVDPVFDSAKMFAQLFRIRWEHLGEDFRESE